jgi:lysophospholipase L1-like esterase
MSEANETALGRLIAQVRSRGIDVVLLLEPGRHPEATESLTSQYIGWLSHLATDLEVPTIDAHNQTWDPSFFADEAHFNREGTVAFTRFMAAELASLQAE